MGKVRLISKQNKTTTTKKKQALLAELNEGTQVVTNSYSATGHSSQCIYFTLVAKNH